MAVPGRLRDGPDCEDRPVRGVPGNRYPYRDNPSCNRKSGYGNPPPTAGAPQFYPNKPAPRHRSTRRNIKVRPFGVDFDRRSLRSDCRQGSKPAARRSARTSLRVLDCVLASATVLSSGSWRSPFFDCRWPFYEFSVVLEVMAPQKNRSASLLARNFWAMREGRPVIVSFLSGFSIRSERSALDE
jgi:hypothetical protein